MPRIKAQTKCGGVYACASASLKSAQAKAGHFGQGTDARQGDELRAGLQQQLLLIGIERLEPRVGLQESRHSGDQRREVPRNLISDAIQPERPRYLRNRADRLSL